MPEIEIKPFTADITPSLQEHFQRNRGESGKEGIYFSPFEPDDPDGPSGLSVEKTQLPLDTPGWLRIFYALDTNSGQVVGHVDLKSDGLKTGLHRCMLGIGIETPYRGMGIGTRLMNSAIEFARSEQSLVWIDLGVFSNNLRAFSLYKQLGFIETGTVRDRFRIGGESIDDIQMVLNVA